MVKNAVSRKPIRSPFGCLTTPLPKRKVCRREGDSVSPAAVLASRSTRLRPLAAAPAASPSHSVGEGFGSNPPLFPNQKVCRREGDSNPRYLAAQRFSRPPDSTALASLQSTLRSSRQKRLPRKTAYETKWVRTTGLP